MNADLCTSCGSCAGSCSQLAIGPPARSGHVQLRLVKEVRRQHPEGGIVFIHCRNGAFEAAISTLSKIATHVVPYGVECTGSLHPTVVEQLLKQFRGVMVASCSPEACLMREGPRLTEARLMAGQSPSRLGQDDRVLWAALPFAHSEPVVARFRELAKRVGAATESSEATREAVTPAAAPRRLLAVALVASALGVLVAGNHVTIGGTREEALLRAKWRMSAPKTETCRQPTSAEQSRAPTQIQLPEICDRVAVPYRLSLRIDEGQAESFDVVPTGREETGPLIVNLDRALKPGTHRVQVTFLPRGEAPPDAPRIDEAFSFSVDAGRVAYLTFDARSGEMLLRTGPGDR